MRQRYLQRCDQAAWALDLVLVTVADAAGLSYYSDESLQRMLRLDHAGLSGARAQLCQVGQVGLVAYQKPLYQVLGLEDPAPLPLPATLVLCRGAVLQPHALRRVHAGPGSGTVPERS